MEEMLRTWSGEGPPPNIPRLDAPVLEEEDDPQLAHWAPKRRKLNASQRTRRRRWDVQVKAEVKTEAEEAAARVVTPTTPPRAPEPAEARPAGAATPPDGPASSDDEVTVVYEGPPTAPATPPECVTLSSDEDVGDREPREDAVVDGHVPLIWAVRRLLRAGAQLVHRTGGDEAVVGYDWTVRPSTPMYATVNPVRYESLHPGTDEYEAIRTAFESTSGRGSGFRVTGVIRVENDRLLYLFQCQVRRLEYSCGQAAVLRLFHGAPLDAINALCRGGDAGAGRLFSPLSGYCARLCAQRAPSRSMLVCDVVMARVSADSRLREDPGRVYDTILGLNSGPEVLCKPAYAFFQFYPAYVVMYEAGGGVRDPQPSKALMTPKPPNKSQQLQKTQKPQKREKPPQTPRTPRTPRTPPPSPPSARWWT